LILAVVNLMIVTSFIFIFDWFILQITKMT